MIRNRERSKALLRSSVSFFLFSLVLALSVRLFAAFTIRIWRGGHLFLDDKTYIFSGLSNPSYEDSFSFFWFVVRIVRTKVLDDPYALQSVVALFAALAIATISTVISRLRSLRHGIFAALLLSFWPSYVLWSSLVLRESTGWLAVSGVLLALTIFPPNNSHRLTSLAALALLVLSHWLFFGVRQHSAILSLTAAIVALFVRQSRKWKVTIALCSLILVALFISSGSNYLDTIISGSNNFGELRAAEVNLANSKTSCAESLLPISVTASDYGWKADLSCLPAGLIHFTLGPFLTQVPSAPTLLPFLLEIPFWIGLYFLAFRSISAKSKSLPHLYCLILIPLLAIFWGLTDRVTFTALRHRSEILIPLVFLMFGPPSSNPPMQQVRPSVTLGASSTDRSLPLEK